MRASVPDGLRWRLRLYETVLGLCRQGGFTLSRFLALPPDRLRLSVGESRAKMEIPVAVAGDVDALLETHPFVGVADVPQGTPIALSGDALRQVLRIAQVDSELDPLAVAGWVQRSGDAFIRAIARSYQQAFTALGQPEGGEEVAYLVHIVWLERLKAKRGGGDAAVVAALLEGAIQGAASASGESDTLGAALALRLALTASALTLGVPRASVIDHPLNAYRTMPDAAQCAEGILAAAPLESLDPAAAVSAVAKQLLGRPELRSQLARDVLLERVRDCALLASVQLHGPSPSSLGRALRRLASAGKALAMSLREAPRRTELLNMIRAHPRGTQQPLMTLSRLLEDAETALRIGGASSPDLDRQAELAATGAVLLSLDDRAAQAQATIASRLRWVPKTDLQQEYARGRCYRISLSGEPLARAVAERQEAHLFVDMKDFTSRTAAIKERAMGDFLKRFFYSPIFELAARVGGHGSIQISNIVGDAVAFRGEVRAIVTLAQGIRRILHEAEHALSEGVSDALGGDDGALQEIREELGRTDAQLAMLEARNLAATPSEADARSKLLAKQALLKESLESRLARGRGLGLEAGIYIAHGAAAEHVDLSHPSWGRWSVTIAERLNEAARGTARSGAVKAEWEAALTRARQEQGRGAVRIPFQVRVGARTRLQLEPAAADALSQAVFRQDRVGATHAVKALAQQLAAVAVERIDRRETDLTGVLDQAVELYNAGCAVSGATLQAYRRAAARELAFEHVELYQRDLPTGMRQRFLIDEDPERFVAVYRKSEEVLHELFRFSGRVPMKGFEREGSVEVWELISGADPFVHALAPALKRRSG